MKRVFYLFFLGSMFLTLSMQAQYNYLGLRNEAESKAVLKPVVINSSEYDHSTQTEYVKPASPNNSEKTVVVEEGTGTWCQWCPGGTYYGDSLTKMYDNVIVVAVHGGDVMENSPHVDGAGFTAYPSANIDRDVIGAYIEDWFANVQAAMQETPAAGVEVSVNFNEDSRLLSTEVSATFQSDVSGDYRFGAVVVENGVFGLSPSYDQSNSYSGGDYGWMGGFSVLPSPVPANMIAYNHVSRTLLGGYNGESGSLPNPISSGETHSYTFEYTLPDEYDPDNTYLVAWLIKPDGKIDNANKSLFLSGVDNAKPVFMSNPIVEGYVDTEYTYAIFCHDPDKADIEITAVTLPSWLILSDTYSLDHIHNSAILSGTPVSDGEYDVTLQINDGGWTVEQSFTIVVESALSGSWELIGAEGFTTADANNQDMAIDDQGTCYLISKVGGFMDVYKKEESGEWTSMALNINGASFGQIEIASDGTPFVAYASDNGIVVKKYEGANWVNVGNSPTTGVQIGMALDSQDNPYICCQDGNNGYDGTAYGYDGSSWTKLGGVPYSGEGVPGVWNQMLIDDADNVYVLWADWYAGQIANVSFFDGSSWSLVGESPVSDMSVYFYQSFTMDDQGQIYVAFPEWETQSCESFIFDGSSWASAGSNLTDGAVEYCDMSITDEGKPVLTFLDISYSNTISAMKLGDSSWEFIGPRGFTGTSGTFPVIATYMNSPYVCYADAALGEKATTQRYAEVSTSWEEFADLSNQVSIYPNPTHSQFSLMSNKTIQRILLLNISGQQVKDLEIDGNTALVDVSVLNKGIYFLKIYSEGESTTMKLMVQ